VKLGAIYREKTNLCVLPRVWKAANVYERTRGLLGRPPLATGEGLLIDRCRMVHTMGMHYALDLVFLDADGHIRKMVANLLPLRLAGAYSAQSTLELPAGALAGLGLHLGEPLIWREVMT
jgi:uncharacterized membrane protein (UPF0127 family)